MDGFGFARREIWRLSPPRDDEAKQESDCEGLERRFARQVRQTVKGTARLVTRFNGIGDALACRFNGLSRRPNGFYIPRYRNLFGDKRSYLRGFGYQGSAGREGWGRGVAELGVGGDFKDALSTPGHWTIGATAFGEMLPNHANMVSLDPAKKDKWGLPVLKIDCATGENERMMRRDMQVDMAELLDQSGVKDVNVYDRGYFPGMGIHEMGTARMGKDPKTSVLNSQNQVWDAPNVFVTDGSCMVSAACVNPSLTYMALTARAADFAVQELKRQNI